MKKYAGEEFLNRLYKDLVHSAEVNYTAKGADKNEDLAIYLERLDRITKKANNKEKLNLLKYFYYKKYVIKKENVPESYFEHQEQIALERGYGHITYEEKEKKEEVNSIISEQKESLDRWLDYFINEETSYYPMWFKYYVFQNVMKIGYFDKEKNEFTKRTDSTVKPFIEINREAVAMLYDELYKYLDKQRITDSQLEQLIKNGSFNKIYSYIITKLDKVNKIKRNSNEGIWKKYDMGSNPEILFNDINGKGTGWCTAGGIETATAHLIGGDFYVYYTKDENDEYTIPRIAIRMEYGNIAEIRGIAEYQNLENEMENVIEEKLNEFPDKDEYNKKVSDMKELTRLYKKHQRKEELLFEELKFLYEIDSKIRDFGYGKDIRIEEILDNRNKRQDLSVIFNCNEWEISLTQAEAKNGNIRFHYGSLYFSESVDEQNLILPMQLSGGLYLRHLTSAQNLVVPKIGGTLNLSGLKSAEGIILPKDENGEFYVPGNKLYCKFTKEELIEAAKRTEEKQNNYNQHIVKKLSRNI